MSGNLKFRWQGSEYAARILGEGSNGRTLVEALEHGPRFTVGSQLEIEPREIVARDPDPAEAADTSYEEVPPEQIAAMNAYARGEDPAAQALQKAMDAERKTLPTPAEVIANPNFTPPLLASSPAAANPMERPMSDDTAMAASAFLEKMKGVATGAAESMAKLVARADQFNEKKAALDARAETIFALHEKVLTDGHAGLDMIQNGLRQLSNGGPA